jgi:arylsulfatase A
MRFFYLFSVLLLGSNVLVLAGENPKPNIILILADDLGIGNVSVYGADHFKTPNIDQLAATGIRFQRFYSEPLCAPARAKILTGRFNFRTGMTSNSSQSVMKPTNEVLMCTPLHNAGYVTASVGKWHLSSEPCHWGFDQEMTIPGGSYWAGQRMENGENYHVEKSGAVSESSGSGKKISTWNGNYTENGQKKILPQNQYMPDVLNTFAINFITKATKDHKPFFLYYPMSHIHYPILRTPDSGPNESLSQYYQDNVAYMDKLVGKLMSTLKELNIEQNTLVIFAGDNGTVPAFRAYSTIYGGKQLSGCKFTMLEGGAHVPMIAHWLGTTPTGQVCNNLIDSTDLFTTFTELAVGKIPSDRPMDGVSFAPLLSGKPLTTPRQWIFVLMGTFWYDENLKWKLHENGELNDMSNAPFAEPIVPKSSGNPDTLAARDYLQKVLNQLNPKTGKAGIGNSKCDKDTISYTKHYCESLESLLSNPDGSQPGEE